MKATINKLAAAVIFAFILLAGNVRAEGNDAIASSLENTIEATLQLENWMTDETVWNVTETSITMEAEEGLEMENWMISDSTWEVKTTQNVEKDADLQLEEWMINKKVWNI